MRPQLRMVSTHDLARAISDKFQGYGPSYLCIATVSLYGDAAVFVMRALLRECYPNRKYSDDDTIADMFSQENHICWRHEGANVGILRYDFLNKLMNAPDRMMVIPYIGDTPHGTNMVYGRNTMHRVHVQRNSKRWVR